MLVTFDGQNRLIIVNNGVTELSVRKDVYSAWKHWVQELDNAKYLQALRTVGGDPISPTLFLGQTFFLMNGWRMRTWEGDHRLIVNGNLYTEEGDPLFVPTLNPWTIEIALTRSNLIDLLQPTIEAGGIVIPTAAEVADAVWDEQKGAHTVAGSFGKLAQDIPTDVWAAQLVSNNLAGSFGQRVQALPLSVPTVTQIKDAVWNAAIVDHVAAGTFGLIVQTPSPNVADIANAVWADPDAVTIISTSVPTAIDNANAVWNDPDALTVIGAAAPQPAAIAGAVWDELAATHTIAGTFGYLIDQIAEDANQAHIVSLTAVSLLETLLKYEKNRTKIDKTAFTLTVYDDDGVTPIRVFNLKNSLGAPSVTEVTERVPQ